jgi:hypothetical protein
MEAMSLDGFVRCTCIRDGRAKPHPFPERFRGDEPGLPWLSDPSEDEWETHDRWLQESCEHEGYLVSEGLGTGMRAQQLREFLRGLQGEPGLPILLKKVVDDGTHAADGLPVKESPALFRGRGSRTGVERHFDGGREGVSAQHEAVVRSQDRDGQSDYVLTC